MNHKNLFLLIAMCSATAVAQTTPVVLTLKHVAVPTLPAPYTAKATMSGNTFTATLTLKPGGDSATMIVSLNPIPVTKVELNSGVFFAPPQVFNVTGTATTVQGAEFGIIDGGSRGCSQYRSPADFSCSVENFGGPTTSQDCDACATIQATIIYGGYSLGVFAYYSYTTPAPPPVSNAITIGSSLPTTAQPLAAFADSLPPFCASGTYSYSGPNKAVISFDLQDSSGKVLITSNMKELPAGSNLSWGTGCGVNSGASQLIFVKEIKTPTFQIPPGTAFNKLLGTVQLVAHLDDSETFKTLATSAKIPYNIVPGAAVVNPGLKLIDALGKTTSVDLTIPFYSAIVRRDLAQIAAKAMGLSDQNDLLALTLALNYTGSEATLDADVTMLGTSNNVVGGASLIPQTISAGSVVNEQHTLQIRGTAPAGTTAVRITPSLTSSNGQKMTFDPVTMNFESVAILVTTPANEDCVFSNPKTCLTKGTQDSSQSIVTTVQVNPRRAGEQLIRSVTRYSGVPIPVFTTLTKPQALTPNQSALITDTIPLGEISEDLRAILISYELHLPNDDLSNCDCPADSTYYRNFYSKVTPQLGRDGPSGVYSFADGAMTNFRGQAASTTASLEFGTTAGQFALAHPKAAAALLGDLKLLGGTVPAAVKGPDPLWDFAARATPHVSPVASPVVGIGAAWAFDPPIPHDGSMSATITLNYSAADLPDDPNFVESKMQIVSYEASGTMHTYVTTVDTVKKTATAVIDGLDPYYSLAVVGQLTQTSVMFATVPTGYTVVNTGKQDSALGVTNYVAGSGTKTTPALKAGHVQASASTTGWVQVWADSPSVAGVALFNGGVSDSGVIVGAPFAVIPAASPANAFLITDVEYDTKKSTEIDLANPSTSDQTIAISLIGADGSVQGSTTTTLAAKSQLISRVEGIFPSVKAGFTGYAVVAGQQPLIASALQLTNSTATGIVAQPVTGASLDVTSLYAPQLGGSGTTSTLHLINGSANAANLTLKARLATGAAAATNVLVKLASGQQYTKAINDIFGIDPSVTGSIEVDSDQPGIFGDVLTTDNGFVSAYAYSVPLSAAPQTGWVLPYATSSTTVNVFNPSATAANVAVTPYGSDGTAGVPVAATIPANGASALTVSAGSSSVSGYVTIASTQPVVATGTMIVPLSLTTAGYGALPAILPAPSGGGGPAPTITGAVNGASFISKLARGAWATITGGFTATQTTASGTTLPNSLAGVSVTVGGIAAPIYYVQSGQVNFLVPREAPLGSAVPVVISVNGSPSSAVNVPVADYAVGAFLYGRNGTIIDPIIVHLNNTIVTPDNPAAPNETLVIYANGIGKLTNPPATGATSPGSPPAQSVDTLTFTVGGTTTPVGFAGLTPGLFGLVQLNITLPASLPSGTLPLIVNSPGDTSPSVNLYVKGNVTTAPKLGSIPATLGFPNATVGQSSTQTLAISNIGTAPLVVSSITSQTSTFSITSATSFTLQPGGSTNVSLKFTPASAGNQNGTLTIVSNDPSSGSVSVLLFGTGVAGAAAAISVAPTSLDFGTVAAGQTKDIALQVNNNGSAVLTVTSVTSSNARFAPAILATPFNVGQGSFQNVIIRFSPTDNSAQTGTLALASNDPAKPSLTVSLKGNSSGSTPTQATLSVDGGTFNNTVGLPSVASATFVNRLTPPSYPATLTTVQIYFGNRTNGLAVNAPISVLVATNASGASAISSATLKSTVYSATVAALGAFNSYTLAVPVTITSGDFVVGFTVPNPTGVFPADQDQASKSQGRSYVSSDGASYTIMDSYGAALAGNFGIRAVVTLGPGN